MVTFCNGQTDTFANPRPMAEPTGNLITLGKRSYTGTYVKTNIFRFTYQNSVNWTLDQIKDLYYKNIIPSGATQWSMNNTTADQNGGNNLTLSGTSYSNDVPFNPRQSV